MAETTIFTHTTWDADADGGAQECHRQLIPASALVADGESIRLTLRASESENLSLDHIYIGHAAAAGDDWDFDGNQVRVTFASANNVEITAGSTEQSDEITFSLDSTKDLIVAYLITNNAAKDAVRRDSSETGFYRYWKATAAEADVTDDAPAGFSTTADKLFTVAGIVAITAKISFLDTFDIVNHPAISFLDRFDVHNLHRVSFLDQFDIKNIHRISFLDPWNIKNFTRVSMRDDFRILLRRGYNVYLDGVWQAFIAVGAALEWVSAALAYPATYEFRVHAQHDLFEERDPSNIIKLVLKADGSEDDPRPNAVLNARATNLASGNMLLEWSYDRANQNVEPTQFKIWYDTSSPVSTAGDADFTVPYNSTTWKTEYSQKTGALAQNTYYFIIRSATADIDDGSTTELENTNDATAPDSGQNVRASAE